MQPSLARLLSLLFLWNVAVQAQSTPEEKGREVFRACQACHNTLTDARKAAPSLRVLFGKVRLINGKRTTEENVMQLIKEGYNRMPSYQYLLRPKDWEELMAFLKTLRGRPEIVPVLQSIRGSDEEVLAKGKTHYAEHCFSCHDQGGKAPDLFAVYKRGALADGRRVEEEAVVRLVREGHGEMSAKADSLDNAALFSLIAYLKAQQTL